MKNFYYSCISFFKKETVLCAAAFAAIISAFFVLPSVQYIAYLDFRVLSLLFCLMLVVSGLQSIGLFSFLGTTLLYQIKNTRQLSLLLVTLCFFSSMFITNDVALITFVPFAVMILAMAKAESLLIPIISLQTIAANLGSMLTPIGNPQNLYLYSAFSLSVGTFLSYMLPLAVLSFILLGIAVILLPNKPLSVKASPAAAPVLNQIAPYLILFLICLSCVIRILPYQAMLFILIVSVFLINKKLFRSVDYKLLLTFICFFIFIGNMRALPAVSAFLSRLISGRELILGSLLSQAISNVPAAILLSGFTNQVRPLLYGVNIGGLGTLIASLASVISYHAYANIENAQKGSYLKIFTIYNIIFLLILLAAAILLLSF